MKAVSYLGLTLLEARKRYLEIIAVSFAITSLSMLYVDRLWP